MLPLKALLAAVLISALTWVSHAMGWPILVGVLLIVGIGLVTVGLKERDLPHEDDARLARSSSAIAAPRRVLIVGTDDVATRLARGLEKDGRYRVIGLIDEELASGEVSGWPILGNLGRTADLVHEYSIQDVFVAQTPAWQHRLLEQVTSNGHRVDLHLVPGVCEAMLVPAQVNSYGDVASVPLVNGARRASDLSKRWIDVAGALFGGALCLGPGLVIAAVIRITSRGPAIYPQERVGKDGKSFTLYKFRTMVDGAENDTGPILSPGEDDGRLTPVGRWLKNVRADELPQLWNVLRGEMSLVGPRPERPHFVEQFKEQIPGYGLRHQVRPGITGLAQVCGNYHTHARDKLRFDLIYTSQRSLWLDLVILCRTVGVCLGAGKE